MHENARAADAERGFEFGNEFAATEREVGLDPRPERSQGEALEAGDLSLCEGLGREIESGVRARERARRAASRPPARRRLQREPSRPSTRRSEATKVELPRDPSRSRYLVTARL